MLEKFITRDNIIIIIVAVITAVGFVYNTNYFSTKLEVSQLRNEVLQQKIELMKYSDNKDDQILEQLETKYEKILQKLDQIRK